MSRSGFVYIITNTHHTTLYVGATNNLPARIIQHRDKIDPKSFSARYNLHKLVYYEAFDQVHDAFVREYQIKSWSRVRKEVLIASMNPEWKDLFDEIAEY